MTKWIPIEELKADGRKMFVVISIRPNYVSDPYCVWLNEDGSFGRWPHDYKPTHFVYLPKECKDI